MNKYGVEPLAPAYGRDYKSKAKLLEDWDANADFQTAFGQYTSQSELATSGIKDIQVRYDSLQKVVVLPVRS